LWRALYLGRYHYATRQADAHDPRRTAEFERSLILTRTGEGRARAMARGVKFGRKHKLTSHQMQEAKRRRDAGESLSEIGRLFGVNYQTIGRR
jgi:DNA invertase Pin-like site-specific DNA recombinase